MTEKIRSEGLEINVTPSLLIFLFNYTRKVFYEGYSISDDTSSPTTQSPSEDTSIASVRRAPSQTQIGHGAVATGGERVDGSGVAQTESGNESRPTRIDLSSLPTGRSSYYILVNSSLYKKEG